jgi:hypothetical protein
MEGLGILDQRCQCQNGSASHGCSDTIDASEGPVAPRRFLPSRFLLFFNSNIPQTVGEIVANGPDGGPESLLVFMSVLSSLPSFNLSPRRRATRMQDQRG